MIALEYLCNKNSSLVQYRLHFEKFKNGLSNSIKKNISEAENHNSIIIINEFLIVLADDWITAQGLIIIQWLMSAYNIHKKLQFELLVLGLPYIQNQLFVRLCQSLYIEESNVRTKWAMVVKKSNKTVSLSWLMPIIKSNVPAIIGILEKLSLILKTSICKAKYESVYNYMVEWISNNMQSKTLNTEHFMHRYMDLLIKNLSSNSRLSLQSINAINSCLSNIKFNQIIINELLYSAMTALSVQNFLNFLLIIAKTQVYNDFDELGIPYIKLANVTQTILYKANCMFFMATNLENNNIKITDAIPLFNLIVKSLFYHSEPLELINETLMTKTRFEHAFITSYIKNVFNYFLSSLYSIDKEYSDCYIKISFRNIYSYNNFYVFECIKSIDELKLANDLLGTIDIDKEIKLYFQDNIILHKNNLDSFLLTIHSNNNIDIILKMNLSPKIKIFCLVLFFNESNNNTIYAIEKLVLSDAFTNFMINLDNKKEKFKISRLILFEYYKALNIEHLLKLASSYDFNNILLKNILSSNNIQVLQHLSKCLSAENQVEKELLNLINIDNSNISENMIEFNELIHYQNHIIASILIFSYINNITIDNLEAVLGIIKSNIYGVFIANKYFHLFDINTVFSSLELYYLLTMSNLSYCSLSYEHKLALLCKSSNFEILTSIINSNIDIPNQLKLIANINLSYLKITKNNDSDVCREIEYNDKAIVFNLLFRNNYHSIYNYIDFYKIKQNLVITTPFIHELTSHVFVCNNDSCNCYSICIYLDDFLDNIADLEPKYLDNIIEKLKTKIENNKIECYISILGKYYEHYKRVNIKADEIQDQSLELLNILSNKLHISIVKLFLQMKYIWIWRHIGKDYVTDIFINQIMTKYNICILMITFEFIIYKNTICKLNRVCSLNKYLNIIDQDILLEFHSQILENKDDISAKEYYKNNEAFEEEISYCLDLILQSPHLINSMWGILYNAKILEIDKHNLLFEKAISVATKSKQFFSTQSIIDLSKYKTKLFGDINYSSSICKLFIKYTLDNRISPQFLILDDDNESIKEVNFLNDLDHILDFFDALDDKGILYSCILINTIFTLIAQLKKSNENKDTQKAAFISIDKLIEYVHNKLISNDQKHLLNYFACIISTMHSIDEYDVNSVYLFICFNIGIINIILTTVLNKAILNVTLELNKTIANLFSIVCIIIYFEKERVSSNNMKIDDKNKLKLNLNNFSQTLRKFFNYITENVNNLFVFSLSICETITEQFKYNQQLANIILSIIAYNINDNIIHDMLKDKTDYIYKFKNEPSSLRTSFARLGSIRYKRILDTYHELCAYLYNNGLVENASIFNKSMILLSINSDYGALYIDQILNHETLAIIKDEHLPLLIIYGYSIEYSLFIPFASIVIEIFNNMLINKLSNDSQNGSDNYMLFCGFVDSYKYILFGKNTNNNLVERIFKLLFSNDLILYLYVQLKSDNLDTLEFWEKVIKTVKELEKNEKIAIKTVRQYCRKILYSSKAIETQININDNIQLNADSLEFYSYVLSNLNGKREISKLFIYFINNLKNSLEQLSKGDKISTNFLNELCGTSVILYNSPFDSIKNIINDLLSLLTLISTTVCSYVEKNYVDKKIKLAHIVGGNLLSIHVGIILSNVKDDELETELKTIYNINTFKLEEAKRYPINLHYGQLEKALLFLCNSLITTISPKLLTYFLVKFQQALTFNKQTILDLEVSDEIKYYYAAKLFLLIYGELANKLGELGIGSTIAAFEPHILSILQCAIANYLSKIEDKNKLKQAKKTKISNENSETVYNHSVSTIKIKDWLDLIILNINSVSSCFSAMSNGDTTQKNIISKSYSINSKLLDTVIESINLFEHLPRFPFSTNYIGLYAYTEDEATMYAKALLLVIRSCMLNMIKFAASDINELTYTYLRIVDNTKNSINTKVQLAFVRILNYLWNAMGDTLTPGIDQTLSLCYDLMDCKDPELNFLVRVWLVTIEHRSKTTIHEKIKL